MKSTARRQAKGRQEKVDLPVPLPLAHGDRCQSALPSERDTGEDEKSNRRERDDKEYCAYRDLLVKMESDAGKEFDKWVLTVAGIALGFSLNFTKDYKSAVGGPAVVSIGFLYASWIGFAATVFLLVTNMLMSHSALGAYRRIADDEYKKYDASDDLLFQRITERQSKVVRNKCVHLFNVLSWIGFTLGLVALVLFVYGNSQTRSTEMANESKPPKPDLISSIKPEDIRSTGGAPTPRVVPVAPVKNVAPASPTKPGANPK